MADCGGEKTSCTICPAAQAEDPTGSLKCHDTSNYCSLWSEISFPNQWGNAPENTKYSETIVLYRIHNAGISPAYTTPQPAIPDPRMHSTGVHTEMENCGRY